MLRVGTYELRAPLGRGGMGTVWHAVSADGVAVAIKLASEGVALHERALRREVAAMARLAHPGLVAFVDHGVHEGSVWVAMRWVQGQPLSDLFRPSRAAETTPLVWDDAAPLSEIEDPEPPGQLVPEALGVLATLCAPLAYLHGEGLVHRDVKPENILVGADGRPVLVDLGLLAASASTGREQLELDARKAGTPAYMAPEQIRGDFVDARTDLYALGCVLYEALCGSPPFAGTASQVARQQLTSAPMPLSDRVDIAPELDALVAALLEKRPTDRPGRAEDVAAVLTNAGYPAMPWPGAPEPRPRLFRAAWAGSTAPLDRLAAWRRGPPSLAVLGGPPGAGRTRACLEVARAAADEGWRVVTASCVRDGEPMALWRPLLERVDVADPRSGQDAMFVAEAASRLPERALLVVDDLHHADERSLAVLERRAALAPGLSVLVSCRDGEESVPLRRVLLNAAVRVDLGPLSPEASVDLSAGLAGRREPLGVQAGLAAEVVEAVRCVLDEGGDASGSLDALLARRLDRLRPATRWVLDALTVVGGRAEVAVLVAMAEPGSGPGVDLALHELTWQGLVEGEDVVALGSDRVREVALARLSDAARIARRALEVLDVDTVDPVVLGGVYELAGEQALASRAWRGAGRVAALASLQGRAVQHFERALALVPESDLAGRWDAHTRLSQALGITGRTVEALRHAEAAVALGPALGTSHDLTGRGMLAMVLLRSGHPEEAAERVRGVLEAARELGDDELVANASNLLGAIEAALGHFQEALACHRATVELSRTSGDLSRLASAMTNVGTLSMDMGAHDESVRMLRQSLTLARTESRNHSVAAALHNLGLALLLSGELEEAAEALDEARAIAAVVEAPRMLSEVWASMALVRVRLGAPRDEVEDCLARARRCAGLAVDVGREGELAVMAVSIHRELGDPPESLVAALAALDATTLQPRARFLYEVERGFAALLGGSDPLPHLAEAGRLGAGLGVPDPDIAYGGDLGRLRAAIQGS